MRSMLHGRRDGRLRAFVLIGVVVAIGVAMAVTSAALWSVRAEHAGRLATTEGLQRRAVAWSAAQAVAALAGSQRSTVLAGGEPTLATQITLFEDGPRTALLRLLPASEDGRWIVAEASRLDVSGATAEALAAIGLDESMISHVMDARRRAGGRIETLEEVIEQGGVPPTALRGAAALSEESLAVIRGARGGEEGRVLARAGSALRSAGSALAGAGSSLRGDALGDPRSSDAAGAGGAPPLQDLVTPFAVEPSISRDGDRRIEIDGPWIEVMREIVGDDLDAEGLKRLEALAEGGFAIHSDSTLVQCLASIELPREQWGKVLDRVTAESDAWRWGRLDINRADAALLATLPGVSAEQAVRWVRERTLLDLQERADPAWPLRRGLVEPSQFAELFPRITTRSFFWRVRFVAGFADADDPDGPMSGVSILECVIDLSGPTARLAAMRDLTLAPVLERLLAESRRHATEMADAAPRARSSSSEYAPRSSAERSRDSLDRAEAVDRAASAPSADSASAPGSAEARAGGGSTRASPSTSTDAPERPRRAPRRERGEVGASGPASAPARSQRTPARAESGGQSAPAPAAAAANPQRPERPSSPAPAGRYRPRSPGGAPAGGGTSGSGGAAGERSGAYGAGEDDMGDPT